MNHIKKFISPLLWECIARGRDQFRETTRLVQATAVEFWNLLQTKSDHAQTVPCDGQPLQHISSSALPHDSFVQCPLLIDSTVLNCTWPVSFPLLLLSDTIVLLWTYCGLLPTLGAGTGLSYIVPGHGLPQLLAETTSLLLLDHLSLLQPRKKKSGAQTSVLIYQVIEQSITM
jgi:hypothetical protein